MVVLLVDCWVEDLLVEVLQAIKVSSIVKESIRRKDFFMAVPF